MLFWIIEQGKEIKVSRKKNYPPEVQQALKRYRKTGRINSKDLPKLAPILIAECKESERLTAKDRGITITSIDDLLFPPRRRRS